MAATVFAALMVLLPAGAAMAGTESLSVSSSANPLQGAPMTITVQGVANGNDDLYVYVGSGSTCESTPYEETVDAEAALASGVSVPAGNFTETYSYTSSSDDSLAPSPFTDVICAYLDDSFTNGEGVSATASFTAAVPTGSISFSVSADPIATLPTTITVDGSSQISRDLFVYVASQNDATCSDEPPPPDEAVDFGATELATGTPIAAGSFSETYNYTPAQVGTYSLCAYLGDDSYDAPEATATGSFTVTTGASITATDPPNGTTFVKPPVRITFDVVSPAGTARAEQVDFSTNSSNIAQASVGGPWGPGQHTVTLPIPSAGAYYWKVVGTDGSDQPLSSEVSEIRIQAPRVHSVSVQAKDQGATWQRAGSATVDTSTAPWESLTVTLTHGQTKIETLKTFTGSTGKVVAHAIVSCPTFGDFVWTVVVSDGQGDQLSRRVRFRTPACGPKPRPASPGTLSITAAERAISDYAEKAGAASGLGTVTLASAIPSTCTRMSAHAVSCSYEVDLSDPSGESTLQCIEPPAIAYTKGKSNHVYVAGSFDASDCGAPQLNLG
ncbi:MAG: hypothetical protein ACLP8S_11395 [Solirubrobacteraceae bacterium]